MKGCELSTRDSSGELKWRTARCESGSCVGVAREEDGQVLVRNMSDPEAPVARFTQQEWKAFIAGVKTGEFDDFAASIT